MGNIEFFSFKRHISDDEMDTMLREVASELFDTAVEVKKVKEWSHWDFLIREDLVPDAPGAYRLSFSLYREGPRKFGGKMGRGGLSNWLRMTILEMAASRLGHATFSNEGVTDTWRPEPLKYPTYREYLENVVFWGLKSSSQEGGGENLQEAIARRLRHIPEPLQKVQTAKG